MVWSSKASIHPFSGEKCQGKGIKPGLVRDQRYERIKRSESRHVVSMDYSDVQRRILAEAKPKETRWAFFKPIQKKWGTEWMTYSQITQPSVRNINWETQSQQVQWSTLNDPYVQESLKRQS